MADETETQPVPAIHPPAAADPREAAAIIAAVQQFIAETTPVARPESRVNPWQRAALIEGTSAKQAFASPWGEERTWGERHSRRP